jgi:hypothetical protein
MTIINFLTLTNLGTDFDIGGKVSNKLNIATASATTVSTGTNSTSFIQPLFLSTAATAGLSYPMNSLTSIGAGTNSTAAFLNIAAGTTSKAAMKLASGTVLSAVSTGSVEYDGVTLYFTPVSTRREFAFLDSPALSGTPTAPTAPTATKNTQIATTAFVKNSLSAVQVNVADYGAVGDGITDDTTALTNFWNHAIANPGVPHMLGPNKYKITNSLPSINVSNVIIRGAGSYYHDAGPVLSGTVIFYAGSSGATIISVVSVAGNPQVTSNIEFTGIGIDCNSLAAVGFAMRSVRDSNIDVSISGATSYGMYLGVITGSVSESKDTQRNKIKLFSKQIFGAGQGGATLWCDGDSVANVSMNEFWIEAEHYNNTAIYLVNSDTNDWRYVRLYKVGGTATDGISCLGNGTSYALTSRDEIFHFYSANLPIHVYGTAGAIAYAYPSVGHRLKVLDIGNGTPAPVVEVGGSMATDLIGGSTVTVVNSTDAGTVGQVTTDANYIYVCVAANTWKRVAITTW